VKVVCQFARLKISETDRLDVDHLEGLAAALGRGEAERLVGVTYDEMAEALGDVDAAYRAGDVTRIVARVAELIDPCEAIGLGRIAGACRAVVATGEAADAAGFAATVARLIRLIEGSLSAVFEVSDMIG
jgi:hypothetical protein